MKPQPPEYPRNVPDIDFEEDILLPGAIEYTQDEDDACDAEELERIRAAKRRRIEANAHAYLRGEGLFILTAGLRGPFDNGWQNPWAAKSKKRKHDAVSDETAVSRAQQILRKDHLGSQTPWKSNHARQPIPLNPFERARSERADQPSPEQKVENWLRRNSAFARQKTSVKPLSPTPKMQLVPMPRAQSEGRHGTPTKQVITVSSQHAKAPIHHPDQRVAESFETVVLDGQRNAQRTNAHSRLQSALKAASPDTARKMTRSQGWVVDNKTEDPTRAEAAIIRMKTRVVDVGSMTADTSLIKKQAAEVITTAGGLLKRTTRKPQREDIETDAHDNECFEGVAVDAHSNRGRDPAIASSEGMLKEPEASIDDQLCQEQPGKRDDIQLNAGEEQGKERYMLPPPSPAASEMQSTNFPPSAQPRPELVTSTSNISSGVLLPKVTQHTISTSAAPLDTGVSVNANIFNVANLNNMHERTSAVDKKEALTLNVSQPQQPLTDAPLVPSPTKESDANRLEKGKAPRKSPAQTKKAKTSNNRKSASFAPEQSSLSSNGSIKNVLKIHKAGQTSKFSYRKTSPPPLFPNRDIDMDTSVEQEDASPRSCSPQTQRHPPNSNGNKPAKSILKSTNTPSSAMLLTSMSQSKLREPAASSHGLLVSGQNGIAHDDEDFDLDGAINEMGSFLSTWDEEKGGVRVS